MDDGSRDGSWSVLSNLAASDPRVRAIRFRRNFGKAAALTAGFAAARGERIFTLDADLQDDPAEIPRFLERLDEGYDVVSGWKKTRHDPWHKVIPSRIFNGMVSRLTGCRLHDHNCGFKLYRREVVREVGIYGELHRFVPVLAHARGFRVGEIEVHHRPRKHGSSKYGFSRFLKGFLDLLTVRFLTRFRQRPLHILGALGVVMLTVGLVGLTYLAVLWVIGDRPIGNRPLLLLLGRVSGRRRAAPEPGNPCRAGHGLQHPHRGYLQHCRDDRARSRSCRLPTSRDRCVDIKRMGFDARKGMRGTFHTTTPSERDDAGTAIRERTDPGPARAPALRSRDSSSRRPSRWRWGCSFGSQR